MSQHNSFHEGALTIMLWKMTYFIAIKGLKIGSDTNWKIYPLIFIISSPINACQVQSYIQY